VTGTGAPAALERLALALGGEFSTTLVQGGGRRACLTVADRQTAATAEVHADDHGRYWWPWAEPAAFTDDPLTAAYRVTASLRGTSTAQAGPGTAGTA
jgi:hypothetical protein